MSVATNSPAGFAAPSASPAPPDVWAEVRARDHVTRYHRLGAGAPVVLLADAGVWPELARTLAGRCRVLLPEVPAAFAATEHAPAGFAGWLRDFIDGLGLETAAVVAAEPYCLAALEFALGDADVVSRVVLVPPGGGPADGPPAEGVPTDGAELTGASDGRLATPANPGALPVLVVRRGVPAAAALPAVLAFLTTSGTGAARR